MAAMYHDWEGRHRSGVTLANASDLSGLSTYGLKTYVREIMLFVGHDTLLHDTG